MVLGAQYVLLRLRQAAVGDLLQHLKSLVLVLAETVLQTLIIIIIIKKKRDIKICATTNLALDIQVLERLDGRLALLV